ncbi:hypothetical protein ACLB2K_060127 [Fragaria x ananassa]
MTGVLAGLPAEQGTRQKDRDVAKEIKRVRVRASPSCWLAASFPLSFCFLLRLFSSPSLPLLFLSVSTPLVSVRPFLLEALASLYRVLGYDD